MEQSPGTPVVHHSIFLRFPRALVYTALASLTCVLLGFPVQMGGRSLKREGLCQEFVTSLTVIRSSYLETGMGIILPFAWPCQAIPTSREAVPVLS